MTTQPTNNQVPSESPRDLKFNAGKIDEFVASLALKYQDRFGGEHYTIEGLRRLAQQAIAQYGWIPVGTFQAGATLTLPNQILKDNTDGEYYRWDGALPKTVPSGSTPQVSGGVGLNAWIGVGDSSLRAMIASNLGASNVGSSSGFTVQDELNELKYSSIPSIERVALTSIKTSVSSLNNIKDPALSYDGFGNSLYYNGRNLFCFRRSPSHIDSSSGTHSACIAEILKDGTYSIVWEYKTSGTVVAKEPTLSVSFPGNQLIISFQLHDVDADTYKNAVVGFPDLSNSGLFSSRSDISTTESYYLWGNVLTTPEGKYITTRYKADGSEVQIIKSSDLNLNSSTSWSVVKTFTLSNFPLRTSLSEMTMSYYRGRLVAFVRTSASGQSLGGMGIAYTGDLTAVNGWQFIVTSNRFAGPRTEAYPKHDDPLLVVGTTQRPITPMYRGDVSITYTYDLSSFTTSRVVLRNGQFNCYASSKKTADGVYELISFDEKTENTNFTNITRSYFYVEAESSPSVVDNNKHDWLQTIINGRPCYGSLALCSSSTPSSNMYFSVKERLSGITRIMLLLGPVSQSVTLNPLLKYMDGTTYATCFNVSVAASSNPQVIEINPVNTLDIQYYGMLNLSLGSPVPIGCTSAATIGAKLPISNVLPFNLYNAVGQTTSPYAMIALAKM